MIKNRWLYVVVFSLVSMGIINTILVRTALRTAMPPVDEGAYDKGMDYEKEITAMKNADKRGISFSFSKNSLDNSFLNIDPGTEDILTFKQCAVRLLRPSEPDLDRNEKLSVVTKQVSFSPILKSGLWLVELRGVLSTGEAFLVKKQIML